MPQRTRIRIDDRDVTGRRARFEPTRYQSPTHISEAGENDVHGIDPSKTSRAR
jgi:hypothetical protein